MTKRGTLLTGAPPIPTSPAEEIVILSVGEAAPSAVVANTSLVGKSLEPGVPSTKAEIVAPYGDLSLPSAPTKVI